MSTNTHSKERINLPYPKSYYITNEVLNSITHGIGFILSIVATVFLIRKGLANENPLEIVSYIIYGLSMCMLYLASTLYHSLSFTKASGILKIIDHSSIFLLIAGSYTPYALVAIGGKFGWFIFIAQWLIALFGIFGKILFLDKMKKFSTWLYILMGWFGVIAIPQMAQAIGMGGIMWLIAGGVTYTVGTIFYSHDDLKYWHVIWHLFVLGGSICMFFSIFLYV
ncbi:hemolysin III family protein [Aerococcus agrisoli]|uniref:Hemolysin III family protein n=1 Tax=Aerococcus agrisoli TaxID=2487350 RepID=A0A3N4G272_9LACT|nr:hemolysin III family protein [Aerococcus agrisoli]RPA57039.1 hemolysin III family protein [Aerococcus agrisoli]